MPAAVRNKTTRLSSRTLGNPATSQNKNPRRPQRGFFRLCSDLEKHPRSGEHGYDLLILYYARVRIMRGSPDPAFPRPQVSLFERKPTFWRTRLHFTARCPLPTIHRRRRPLLPLLLPLLHPRLRYYEAFLRP